MRDVTPVTPSSILDFWFGQDRKAWFQKNPAFDEQIRSRFLIYDGEYVTHCHILVHEDVGMMINVKLVGNGVGPNVPVHTYPPDAAACIKRTSRCPGDTPP